MGPECWNYHKGSGLCIIAEGHPHQLHRVLNNTEVKERNWAYAFSNQLTSFFDSVHIGGSINIVIAKHISYDEGFTHWQLYSILISKFSFSLLPEIKPYIFNKWLVCSKLTYYRPDIIWDIFSSIFYFCTHYSKSHI